MASVRLYSGVPIDNTYKHVLHFSNVNVRDNWFTNYWVTDIANANYNKINNELYIERTYNNCLEINYAKISIDKPSTRDIYAFVIDCELVNERVTKLKLEIDYWTTFAMSSNGNPSFTLQNCFVEREHIDRWSADSSLPIINTYNDSVDDYLTYDSSNEMINREIKVGTTVINELSFVVFTFTKTEDNYKVFKYGVFPVRTLRADRSTDYENELIADYTEGGTGEPDTAWRYPTLQDVYSGKICSKLNIDPASLISIAILPCIESELINYKTVSLYNACYKLFRDNTTTYPIGDIKQGSVRSSGSLINTYYAYQEISDPTRITDYSVNYIDIGDSLPIKPTTQTADYDGTSEPKIYCSPYIKREMCDTTGFTLLEIPDNVVMNTTDKRMHFKTVIEPSDTKQFFYRDSDFIKTLSLGGGIAISGKSIDIPSDAWLNYLLTKKDTDHELLKLNAVTDITNATISNLSFLPIAMGTGIGAVGVAGLLAGSMATGAITDGMAFIKQSVNEKATRNQSSNLIMDGNGITDAITRELYPRYVVKKRNKSIAIGKDTYYKYGYPIKSTHTPNIYSRYYFNYILTDECNLTMPFNEKIKNIFKSIFNNGVTIWHIRSTTDTIFNYTKENIEVALIE